MFKKYFPLFLYIITLGLVFVFFVPPFQKPDENKHYYQVAAISRGILTCKTNSDSQVGLPLPQAVINFPIDLQATSIAHTPSLKFTPNLFSLYMYPKSSSLSFESEWCTNSFIGYIPNAIGAVIGRISSSLLVEFYFSRLMGLMAFIISLFYCLKNTRSNLRPIIISFAVLPMTIHQATSISYDVLTIVLVPLIFAGISSLSKVARIISLVSIVAIVLSKLAYLPFLLLSFLILSPARSLLYIVFALLISIPFIPNLNNAVSIGLPYGVIPSVQYQLIISDPIFFLTAMFTTLSNDFQALYEGFIGNFGWLDYKMNYFFYLIPPILFAWAVKRGMKINTLTRWQLLVMCISLSLSFILVYVALYISWSPVGANTVGGVQGRYFLVLTPFFLLTIASLFKWLGSISIIRKYAVISLLTLAVFYITYLIYLRYYDYSHYGLNDPLPMDLDSETLTLNNPQDFIISLPGDRQKIGGFYYYHTVGTEGPDQYKYQIMDESCRKVLYKGYLQSIYKKENNPYLEKFPPFWIDDNKLCLRFTPVGPIDKPLMLNKSHGEFINPLYLIPSIR